MVPGRPEAYFTYEGYHSIHEDLLKEQEEGISFFYLIKSTDNNILGRINIVDINQNSHSGQIGYRIGENHSGKGVATQAMAMFLNEISSLPVFELYAKTTTNNKGSQIVLERNNFTRVFTTSETVMLNGANLNFVHYIFKFAR